MYYLNDSVYHALVGEIMARAKARVDFACATGVSSQFEEAALEDEIRIALGVVGDVWPASSKE